MSRADQRNLTLAILVFLFVNCSIPFAIGHRWTNSGEAAASWPVAAGAVRNTHYAGEFQDLKISYQYAVNGQVYDGSRIRFGLLGDVRELMDGLKKSSAVDVRYHPADPRTAVLLPDVSDGTRAMKNFGAAGMALCAFAAAAVWRYFAGPEVPAASRQK